MDRTVQDLVDLLLNAVPTLVFFLFLIVYLNYVFFRPLAKILDQRKRETEGVRNLAQQAFESADKKTAEFELALQHARAEIHKHNEQLRQEMLKEQTDAIADARAEAERRIEEAKQEISQEIGQVEAELASKVETMANRIMDSVLRRAA